MQKAAAGFTWFREPERPRVAELPKVVAVPGELNRSRSRLRAEAKSRILCPSKAVQETSNSHSITTELAQRRARLQERAHRKVGFLLPGRTGKFRSGYGES